MLHTKGPNELQLVSLKRDLWITDAAICAAVTAKVWLTKHTQLCIGIDDTMAIFCYALVHPWIIKCQAAELHLFPVQLRKMWKIIRSHLSAFSYSHNHFIKLVDIYRDREDN